MSELRLTRRQMLASAAAAAGLPFLGIRVIIDRLDDRAISVATARNYPVAVRRLRAAVGEALASWPKGLAA